MAGAAGMVGGAGGVGGGAGVSGMGGAPDGGMGEEDGGVPEESLATLDLRFDDSSSSLILLDSSLNENHATRTRQTACVAGLEGLAVNFDQNKDVVEVQDHPSLAITDRLAVAAWVNPTNVQRGAIINEQGPNRTPPAVLRQRQPGVQRRYPG